MAAKAEKAGENVVEQAQKKTQEEASRLAKFQSEREAALAAKEQR